MTERFHHITCIAELIVAEMTGKITEAEQKELEEWKNASRENTCLYEQYRSEEFVRRKFKFVQQNAWNEAYEDFKRKTRASLRRKRRLAVYRYAGVIALLFIVSGIFYLNRGHKEKVVPLVQKIQPGTFRAILTQSDGTKVDISDTTYLAYVKKENRGIAPEKKEEKQPSITRYHTITIPRGGEYTVTLSDGSQLKMNSESEIRVPECFDKRQRDVYMSGEIYFEVARDTTAPFVVHTRQGTIKVLGTSFNVRDYSDEVFLETTLVSGKVAFGVNDEDTYLKPGEQLRLNKENGETKVEDVDVRLYCSWKDGRFVFEQQRLEDIMNTISRWYDIHVFYANQSAKDILFTGNIKRYSDLDQIVDMLKLVNKIDIEINGNNVFVKSSE